MAKTHILQSAVGSRHRDRNRGDTVRGRQLLGAAGNSGNSGNSSMTLVTMPV